MSFTSGRTGAFFPSPMRRPLHRRSLAVNPGCYWQQNWQRSEGGATLVRRNRR